MMGHQGVDVVQSSLTAPLFESLESRVLFSTFDPHPLHWTQRRSNPINREEAQSLVYNGKLYELGGYNYTFDAQKRVDAYDPKTNKWTRKHDMPYAITHAAVAPDPDGHSFWFIGGFE